MDESLAESGQRAPRILSERTGRWIMNLYPPLLFGRVRVLAVGHGFRSCDVSVRRSLFTRNLHGTTFGGTIFSAADPFYAVMYWQAMARRGLRVQSWLKSARIEYLKPAAGHLALRFALEEGELEQAESALRERGRFSRLHRVEANDGQGQCCARIETEVFLRAAASDMEQVDD